MPLALRFCTFLGSRTVLRLETALLQQEQTDSRSCRSAERADVRQPTFCEKSLSQPTECSRGANALINGRRGAAVAGGTRRPVAVRSNFDAAVSWFSRAHRAPTDRRGDHIDPRLAVL